MNQPIYPSIQLKANLMIRAWLKSFFVLGLFLITAYPGFSRKNAQQNQQHQHHSDRYDVIVYGGTAAGVMAAIAASRMGAKVLLLSPDKHLGGVTTSGLGWTDIGNPVTIGGLARSFYHQIWLHYQKDSSWKVSNLTTYQKKLYGYYKIKDSLMWTFEPHVAENILNKMLEQSGIDLITSTRLDRSRKLNIKKSKDKTGHIIYAIRMVDGNSYQGSVYIDASYEGDLMAMAGVSFTVGREANSKYGETINGVEKALTIKNNLPRGIDPYKIKGDSNSGILDGVLPYLHTEDGEGDDKLQAYCYRMCLTNDSANRIMVQKPDGYKKADFELVTRAAALGEKRFWKLSALPNQKIDANNDCGISMDAIGWNAGYVTATDNQRAVIAARHKYWTLGLIWTVQNDPAMPPVIRKRFGTWGLPKDEFTDNGHFPYALYVREARRMIGDYVISQQDVLKGDAENAIAMGSYVMDSHNTQRYITAQGDVQNEGDVQIAVKNPYQIPYGAIIPPKSQCQNLLVPVCLSASHIAYGSIRMEPVFMCVAEAAGTAAAIASKKHQSVQQVAYPELRSALDKAGQVMEIKPDIEVKHP